MKETHTRAKNTHAQQCMHTTPTYTSPKAGLWLGGPNPLRMIGKPRQDACDPLDAGNTPMQKPKNSPQLRSITFSLGSFGFEPTLPASKKHTKHTKAQMRNIDKGALCFCFTQKALRAQESSSSSQLSYPFGAPVTSLLHPSHLQKNTKTQFFQGLVLFIEQVRNLMPR